MAQIPQAVIERVRETSDIVDVISRYVDLKQRGANFFGLCPFHNERTPSFSVAPSKQIYRDQKCYWFRAYLISIELQRLEIIIYFLMFYDLYLLLSYQLH